MSSNTSQRFILKLHSSRIIKSKYDLKLTLNEARENDELITLSESAILRHIDKLNGFGDVTNEIINVKRKLAQARRIDDITVSKPIVKKLYKELDTLQYKKDYVNVVMDKESDYRKILKHRFKINGVEYRMLFGNPNGLKKNTVIFVNSALYNNIKLFVDNGRDLTKPFTPAKLEAYRSLVCSSSTPVSMPNGILVVKDCITHFTDTYIKLDDTYSDDPTETIETTEYELDASDGYGMAMPSLMQRWSEDMHKDYMISGCVIRNAFCKGAVFPVDFQKFCSEHHVEYITDVWGIPRKVSEIELVLTESMLKLWDSYDSLEHYLENCNANGYTFAITKEMKSHLENTRTFNYQFLQSYDFSDEDIDELIHDTVTEIKDILENDYRKTLLYMRGTGMNEHNISRMIDGDIATALMIDERCFNDPHIKSQLNAMIHKRINDAKIGVLNFPANYTIISGDPYALCQSMCGLEVTGLLKAGEIYSKYWINKGVNKIAAFRAPMTCHNNIRVMNVVHNEEMDEFYQYYDVPIIFNAWDMSASSMNGFDYDGDCVITTSSDVIIRNTKPSLPIECIQRKAPKFVPTEEEMAEAHIKSFGNAVGAVTNKVTTMFEVQAGFDKDSEEYKTLDHRIKCGQMFQQNAIDKTKGIDAKPMPSEWYSWHANIINDDDDDETIERKIFNRRILAEKKPYFMRYIYPEYDKKYKDYEKVNRSKCSMLYGMSIEELDALDNKTDDQKDFLKYYYRDIPLGMNPCTINKIAWKIESLFSKPKSSATDFDYTIYKSDVEYDKATYNKIRGVYKEYLKKTSKLAAKMLNVRLRDELRQIYRYELQQNFIMDCCKICPNEKMLCNIVLDMCYRDRKISKQFSWTICGDVIIDNLLAKHNNEIHYPTLDINGEIKFGGDTYRMETFIYDNYERN